VAAAATHKNTHAPRASIKYWSGGTRERDEIRRVPVPSGVALIVEADRETPHDEIGRFAAAHLNNGPWKCVMRRGFSQLTSLRSQAALALIGLIFLECGPLN
jgi:hypothetical protein